MSTWVQHKSGQGNKYEAMEKREEYWAVSSKSNCWYLRLPLDEYIECSPPEHEWVDVTAECDWGNAGEGLEATIFHSGLRLLAGRGYRVRKVELYKAHPESAQNCTQQAFIVEKRKS